MLALLAEFQRRVGKHEEALRRVVYAHPLQACAAAYAQVVGVARRRRVEQVGTAQYCVICAVALGPRPQARTDTKHT